VVCESDLPPPRLPAHPLFASLCGRYREDRGNALLALGRVAEGVGQKLFQPLLDKAIEAARHGLEVYERTLHKSVPPCPREALECIASLARTSRGQVEPFVAGLVPCMMHSGLSIELTAAFLELVRSPHRRSAYALRSPSPLPAVALPRCLTPL